MSGILKKLQIVDEISAKEVLSPILLLSILFLKATRGTYSLEWSVFPSVGSVPWSPVIINKSSSFKCFINLSRP